jgi:hypothetical protein
MSVQDVEQKPTDLADADPLPGAVDRYTTLRRSWGIIYVIITPSRALPDLRPVETDHLQLMLPEAQDRDVLRRQLGVYLCVLSAVARGTWPHFGQPCQKQRPMFGKEELRLSRGALVMQRPAPDTRPDQSKLQPALSGLIPIAPDGCHSTRSF